MKLIAVNSPGCLIKSICRDAIAFRNSPPSASKAIVLLQVGVTSGGAIYRFPFRPPFLKKVLAIIWYRQDTGDVYYKHSLLSSNFMEEISTLSFDK
ncbi:hypothetical protein TNCT_236291 [Trichonephila clavata]|uniref:Uncharacterized protein n=1 Tax=Trichonephila clavata TaxID=2740835 RepID=A0A8X6JFX4_TRICU|nr:hypothetical protein TNCT_236291 [Trichonephila clavata]